MLYIKQNTLIKMCMLVLNVMKLKGILLIAEEINFNIMHYIFIKQDVMYMKIFEK